MRYRRQYIKDALKSPCTLHRIPPESYLNNHCIKVAHSRIDEALRSLRVIPSDKGKPYVVSAVFDPIGGTGYGYSKSYLISIEGLPLQEAQRLFTNMPSDRGQITQYRTLDIISAAIHMVRSSGKPYRRERDDPSRNTSYLVNQEIVLSQMWSPSIMSHLPVASTLLQNIRESEEPLPSKDLNRVVSMDYVTAADVRTASDVVRFIGANGDAEVLFSDG